VSVHSSSLDPPAPLSRKRVCLPLGTKGGGGQHSLAGERAWSQVYVCKKRQVPNQKFLPSILRHVYCIVYCFFCFEWMPHSVFLYMKSTIFYSFMNVKQLANVTVKIFHYYSVLLSIFIFINFPIKLFYWYIYYLF
jgi:hypothetical protein